MNAASPDFRLPMILALAAGLGLGFTATARGEPPLPAAPAAASAPAPAPERSLPADAVLRQLIDESLAQRPELARSIAMVQAEQARVPQAGALPDPMVQLSIQNDGFSSIAIGTMPTSFVSLMVSERFPWPGKLGLSQDLARLGAQQAELALTRARLSTEAEVRRAYLDLLLARDRLELLDQLDSIWQQAFDIARARYESGSGTQSDVLRAQLELNRLQQRRYGLQAEAEIRVQNLNRLSGRPLNAELLTSAHIRDLFGLTPTALPFSESAALDLSPELASAQVSITRNQTQVALAERGYYPDLTVGAGLMFRGELPPMWQVSVAAPVPLFADQKQGQAVEESQARHQAAARDAAAVEQLLRLRSAERRSAFAAFRSTVELYQGGLLVLSAANTESALGQYKVGQASFASVLEANAGLVGDQEGFLQAAAATQRLLIDDFEVSLASTSPPTVSGSGSTSGRMMDTSPGDSAESSANGMPSR